MDFATVIVTLNKLLTLKQPQGFDSSWIRNNAPDCYRFIQGNLRREWGGIDWDRLTCALEKRFQKRWYPRRPGKNPILYEDLVEFEQIKIKYQPNLYVFISAPDVQDRRLRDVIGISFVRLAQKGNLLARREFQALMRYTIDGWMERHAIVARWCGHEEEMQRLFDACIRRYRYTGSFVTYLFRTLEYSARGIAPVTVTATDRVRRSIGFSRERDK